MCSTHSAVRNVHGIFRIYVRPYKKLKFITVYVQILVEAYANEFLSANRNSSIKYIMCTIYNYLTEKKNSNSTLGVNSWFV